MPHAHNKPGNRTLNQNKAILKSLFLEDKDCDEVDGWTPEQVEILLRLKRLVRKQAKDIARLKEQNETLNNKLNQF